MNCHWITPDWPAPKNVKSLTTLRKGGVSQGLYAGLNLGIFSGDDLNHVKMNRQLLKETAKLPNEPCWLKQVHGTHAINIDEINVNVNVNVNVNDINNNEFDSSNNSTEADASYSFKPNQVCVVTTADCLPVLVCDKTGTKVAAIHAGWRGLANGVIEATIEKLKDTPENLLVWLGPAIGKDCFEVGADVKEAFNQPGDADAFYRDSKTKEKWKLDIYQAAKQRLNNIGINQIWGGNFCTYTEQDRFFSYRRSKQSGRMATIIWLSAD